MKYDVNKIQNIKSLLDKYFIKYNNSSFISNDPISIPHSFSKSQDIEISALFAATFAWGRRDIIIKKCRALMNLMNDAPHDFIINHIPSDLSRFKNFKHRTFNYIDTVYFIEFLKFYYDRYDSLEYAFLYDMENDTYNDSNEVTKKTFAQKLINFYNIFFSLPTLFQRTKKHLSSPFKKSACKRLNMFLRWMVRKDAQGVDFGLWSNIKPYELIIPCDVHVMRMAHKLGIFDILNLSFPSSNNKNTPPKPNWDIACKLTDFLCLLDKDDPVKYDFALFGLGVSSF